MSESPVQGTVRFEVTVTFRRNPDTGRWLAQTLQTGVITFGASEDEAYALNGRANVKLVSWWKQQGEAVLREALNDRAIRFVMQPPTATPKPTGARGASQGWALALVA